MLLTLISGSAGSRVNPKLGLVGTDTVLANALVANALVANALMSNALVANTLMTNALVANALMTNALVANALVANALTTNALVTNAFMTNALVSNALVSGLRGDGAGSRTRSSSHGWGSSQLVAHELLLIPHCGGSGVSHTSRWHLIAGNHSRLIVVVSTGVGITRHVSTGVGTRHVSTGVGTGVGTGGVAVSLAHHLLDGSHRVRQLLLGGHVGRHCFLRKRLER
jgi:hypothetical protein